MIMHHSKTNKFQIMLCIAIVLGTGLIHAADMSLTGSNSSPGVGDTITVTIQLKNAPAFANWAEYLSFDKTKLELTGQAGGSFPIFVADARSLSAINDSGEVRSGGFGFANNAGGNGTLGVFTFKTLAAGTTQITTANKSAGNAFGNVLQPLGGADVLPQIAGPLSITIGSPPPQTFSLTTNTSGTGSGSVTFSPSGGTYSAGTVVTVTAIAASGSEFAGWSGDLSGNTNPSTITMNSDKSVTAAFSLLPPPPNVLPIAVAEGSPTSGVAPLVVNFDGSGSSDSDGTIISYSWDFGDGALVGTDSTLVHTYTSPGIYIVTLMVIDNDGGSNTDSLVVIVEAPPPPPPGPNYKLRVIIAGSGTGEITQNPIGDSHPAGTEIQFNATADEDSKFTGWFGDIKDPSDSTFLVMDADKVVVAAFEAKGLDLNHNHSPVIAIGPVFSANPVQVGTEVTMFCRAVDIDNDTLSWTWDFGDGEVSVGGETIEHVYQSAGTFQVKAVVTDGKGESSMASAEIVVEVGGGAAAPALNEPLSVNKAQIRLKFNKPNRDDIKVLGVLPVPANFKPNGYEVTVNVGGVEKVFILDKKGRSRKESSRLKLRMKKRRGVIEAQPAKFMVQLRKGSFAENLLDEGMLNEDVKNKNVQILVKITFNSISYATGKTTAGDFPLHFLYKSRFQKTGTAKSKRRN